MGDTAHKKWPDFRVGMQKARDNLQEASQAPTPPADYEAVDLWKLKSMEKEHRSDGLPDRADVLHEAIAELTTLRAAAETWEREKGELVDALQASSRRIEWFGVHATALLNADDIAARHVSNIADLIGRHTPTAKGGE